MDANLKAKWIEALRRGEYEQREGHLYKEGGYCCLGVLCRVAGFEIDDSGNRISGVPEYKDGYQPLDDVLNGFSHRELWARNDGLRGERKHSFLEIANYIEANIPAE